MGILIAGRRADRIEWNTAAAGDSSRYCHEGFTIQWS